MVIFISKFRTQWVLNPRPHSPPRTYKGEEMWVELELIGFNMVKLLLFF